MSLIVRRAIKKDWFEVAELDRKAWLGYPHGDMIPDGEHTWRIWMDTMVFCAIIGKKIVGAALAFPTLNAGKFVLHKVFVDADYRGQGIGTLLVQSVGAELDTLGKVCYVTVSPENVSAIKVYESAGFTKRQYVKGYYHSDENRLVITRNPNTN